MDRFPNRFARLYRPLAMLLIALLVLVGCAPQATQPAQPAQPAEQAQPATPAAAEAPAVAGDFEWVTPDRVGNPDAPMTISVALEFSYSHQYDVRSRQEYLYARLEEWARANPDVNLTFQIYPGDIPQAHARLLEQASAGRAPDVAMIDGQLVPLFFRFLQPLDQYISEEELDDWFGWAREGAMVDPADGSLKALWFTTNTVGLWYRQDLIPEPPATWDEFIETALAMKEEHGFEHGFLGMGVGEQIPYGLVLPFFFAQGGELVDDEGNPIFGEGANRDAMIAALDFWRRAIDEGATDRKIIDISSTGDLLAEAGADSTAMIMGGSWMLSGMRDVTDLDNWDFAPLPQEDAGNRVQVVGGWNWGVFTDDPEKQARAIDMVLAVYAGQEGMAGWAEAGGYSPVRESIYEEYEFFSEDRWHQRFSEAIAYGRTRPGVEVYPTLSEAIRNAFQEVVLGVNTPEQAVDSAWGYVELETR
jgi:multiple sugar transport system substrate-binding protein